MIKAQPKCRGSLRKECFALKDYEDVFENLVSPTAAGPGFWGSSGLGFEGCSGLGLLQVGGFRALKVWVLRAVRVCC